jgi:mono/diheme cytochrome c family protein
MEHIFASRHRFATLPVVLLAVAAVGCGFGPDAGSSSAASIDRGHYLVTVTGCGDCHTPMKLGRNGPEPDLSRALSGHPEDFMVGPPPTLGQGGWLWAGTSSNTAFAGPWGVSFAANLTADAETGLGMWTEEMFIDAIRQGKTFGGGRPIMPPMPWPAYQHLTDEDLKAIFAFLKSLPPIVNHVPAYQPPAG